jgi:integrase
MRIGELIALQWRDVQFVGDEPTVIQLRDESASTTGRKETGRTTKNGQSRSLPVNPALVGYLKAHRGAARSPVFKSATGKTVDDDKVRKALNAVTRHLTGTGNPTLSEDLHHLSPHGLRHFFISQAASSKDTSESVLMRWVGHADSKLLRHYFHLSDRRAVELMSKLNLGVVSRDVPAEHPISNPPIRQRGQANAGESCVD